MPARLPGSSAAEISGRANDATGSTVGGATVTAKSVETGATRSMVSDADGNFRVLSLAVGQQELRAEKTGFKSIVLTGIELGQQVTVVADVIVLIKRPRTWTKLGASGTVGSG